MSREQSPIQKKAFKLWCSLGRPRSSKEIADTLDITPELVRKWKSYYKWEQEPDPKRGAPKGNSNARGNKGGKGAPPQNDRAVKHGLFRRFLPDDEETREIYDMVSVMSPLDILWESIVTKATNIIKSQRIMHVRDRDDETKVLKRSKPMEYGDEEEWEYQHAWDKQARALTSQATAMTALTRMIKEYEDLLRATPQEDVSEEHRLRLDKLKAEVDKAKTDTEKAKHELQDMRGDNESDAHAQAGDYAAALNAQAADVFSGEGEDNEEA